MMFIFLYYLDVEMSSKLNDYKKNKTGDNEKDNLTFFMAEHYHNILFKPFCSYMDTLLKQREFCKYISLELIFRITVSFFY